MGQPQNSGLLWAEALVAELHRGGVDTFFVSPGSRSTPLVLALARREGIRTVVHVDERGSAFAALGYARAKGYPAAVVTTSGTAVANLLPAVVEASMDAQPLVVLTADRPENLRGSGANQTIDQVGIFGNYVRFAADISAPAPAPARARGPSRAAAPDHAPQHAPALAPVLAPAHADPSSPSVSPHMAGHKTELEAELDGELDAARGAANEALAAALSSNPGPVHINCMFHKPLAPAYVRRSPPADTASDYPNDRHAIEQEAWTAPHGSTAVVTAPKRRTYPCDTARTRRLVAELRDVPRGIVVAGGLPSSAHGQAAVEIARKLGWPLFADISSQVPRSGGEGVVVSYDALLKLPEYQEARPEAVLHLGGRFVSARLGAWLQRHRPARVVHVTLNKVPYDPFGVITDRVNCDPVTLASALDESANEGLDWVEQWSRGSRGALRALAAQAESEAEDTLTEPGVAHAAWSHVPKRWSLVVGNSMPIRDFDAFAWGSPGPHIVVANRGASGIDGLIASACGAGIGAQTPVLAVLGDLSVIHDLSSLSMVARSERPVVLLVVNNGGGGIFSFLPIAEHTDVFEDYFAATHDLTFEAAARQFRIEYRQATTGAELEEVLVGTFRSGRSTIIEVATDRTQNIAAHEKYWDAIRAQLADASNDHKPK